MARDEKGSARSLVIDVVEGLPAAEDADVEALRRARSIRLGLRRVSRLQAVMPSLSYEQLARRSIFRGEPFVL